MSWIMNLVKILELCVVILCFVMNLRHLIVVFSFDGYEFTKNLFYFIELFANRIV